MKNIARIVVGGLTVVGLAVASYRTYEMKKLRKAIELEENVIDVEPQAVEDVTKK